MQCWGNSNSEKRKRPFWHPQQVMHWSVVPTWKQRLEHDVSSTAPFVIINLEYRKWTNTIFLRLDPGQGFWALLNTDDDNKVSGKTKTKPSKCPPPQTWQPGAGLPFSPSHEGVSQWDPSDSVFRFVLFSIIDTSAISRIQDRPGHFFFCRRGRSSPRLYLT